MTGHKLSTRDVYNQLASIYQEKFMDMELYNDTYDAFCNLVQKKGAEILELACGPGNITRYLLKKRPGFKIRATDFAPEMVRLAEGNNPTAVCQVLDCRDIASLDRKFDAIVSGFCLPYLDQEECSKFIRDCSELLQNDSLLYLSTVEGNYSESEVKTGSSGLQVLVHYYTEEFLANLLASNNFKIVSFYRKPYPGGQQHMVFIARLQP